jgi:hypothetical protein
MLIEIFLNVTLKPILWITNAHNMHQLGCWKPCSQLSSENSTIVIGNVTSSQDQRKEKQINNKQHKKKVDGKQKT